MEARKDEKKGSIFGIFNRLKGVKHIEVIVALIAVAIMLLIYFSSFLGKNENDNSSNTQSIQSYYSDYCSKMQAEITNLVSNIKGAGKAVVVISWESSVELIIAATKNESTSSSSSSPVVISNSGSSNPIILKEIYPKALGVAVACEGGADSRIRVSIIMGISALLDINTDKIVVYERKK